MPQLETHQCENWIDLCRCDSTDTRLWYEEGVQRGWFCDFCMAGIKMEYELRKQCEAEKLKEMYDSKQDTLDHIKQVAKLLEVFQVGLSFRAVGHDQSKLSPEEKPIFDEMTPKLKNSTYGSDEYKKFLEALAPALKHHYAENRHHPEHFENGIAGMTLFDLVEMFCDWKAASERHANGSLEKSIVINKDRFQINDQLISIFENTRKALKWS